MQGEAQNVHDMMYDARTQVTEITGNEHLLDLYMQFLALNKKYETDLFICNAKSKIRQADGIINKGNKSIEIRKQWNDLNELVQNIKETEAKAKKKI